MNAEGTLEFERRVNGSPETAFSYFVEPAKHILWQGIRAELEPVPGGAYVVHYSEHSRLRGRYIEVERPNRIVLEWGAESDIPEIPAGLRDLAPYSTTVEISFTPDGDGTIIRVRHSGLPTEAAAGLTTVGWNVYLARIAVVIDGGDPGADALLAAMRGAMGLSI